MTEQRFTAEIVRTDRGGGGHLVEVPPGVVEALGGGGRIPVNATFGGIAYRGSVVRMGGVACIGILKDIVRQLGADHGSTVEVTLERDTAERTVDLPPELASAFESDAALRTAWDALSYTARKEHAAGIRDAKRPETRERRVRAALDVLRSG